MRGGEREMDDTLDSVAPWLCSWEVEEGEEGRWAVMMATGWATRRMRERRREEGVDAEEEEAGGGAVE